MRKWYIILIFSYAQFIKRYIDRKIKIQAKKDHVDLITLFIL